MSPSNLFDFAEHQRQRQAPAGDVHGDRIRAEFDRFDAEHPEVYQRFCELVQELRDCGHRHYSADGILHVIRFHTAVNPKYREQGEFKVNNNYAALYARRWQAEHPLHADFFETRRRKSVA